METPEQVARQIVDTWAALYSPKMSGTSDGLRTAIARLVRRTRAEYSGLIGKREHPEDYCHRCGGRNVGWYADSDLWNQFDPPESIICPICFVVEAESKGVKTPAWRVCPEDVSDEKQRLFVRLHAAQDRIHELERQADAEMAQVLGSDGFLCGLLHGQAGPFVGGCKSHIRFLDAYRCVDCTASFHRDCLRKHFQHEHQTEQDKR